ncbi:hypothetical protein Pmar_PMAR022247 [Perkinsus marinus ATCC 50983]|uniref:Uncharacterized protein n=1 Tax=Perkinsus marinus (strain ATCC 50983 / TXsc) TaxID=423536 RepID=C5KDK8_PERM5|nr:hypothetical protein Pmar_PMAR022247 [Perkinsus marinus ATCC 50983]EER17311.1 hypothetical protein Pmar_PMAR022247 [Perkinsus marinus ATCC 50983]|eukprot:XP_002785515.1 hypothetical protein Pmar_PMAR022247 [Perkinsus marinus ATCC 50983]
MFYSSQVPQCKYVLSKLRDSGVVVDKPRILDVSVNPLNERLWRQASHILCGHGKLTLPIIYDPMSGYALCGDPDILSLILWSRGYQQAMPNRFIKHFRGSGQRRRRHEEDDDDGEEYNDLGPDDIEKRSAIQPTEIEEHSLLPGLASFGLDNLTMYEQSLRRYSNNEDDENGIYGVKTYQFTKVDGINGMQPNQDWPNAYIIEARRSGISHIQVVDVWESVMKQARNGRIDQ